MKLNIFKFYLGWFNQDLVKLNHITMT